MTSLTTRRIESIDLLKGLVMVIMALDHVRDYFHYSANIFNPADPVHSNLPIFFTRWVTHFCAPAFSFLAGLSAFLVGRRKNKAQLARFLLTRGLWLVLIELTVVNFAWYFDIEFRTFGLLVIWSLGISMIVLAALIYTPRWFILTFSIALIAGHNLLDGIHYDGSLAWDLVHQQDFYPLWKNAQLLVGYPLIPWIAVMSLGYYFGKFYDPTVEAVKRKTLFNWIGVTALVLFIILRWTNWYGNPTLSLRFDNISSTLISFLNPAKYPPSLLYLLMTLGAVFIFLANTEGWRGKLVGFFSTFGRVPFFYYILHLFLIHILAMIFAEASGFGWRLFVLPNWIGFVPGMRGYGFSLLVVYAVWIGVILALYPLCRKFDKYKQTHREKWWLSYL